MKLIAAQTCSEGHFHCTTINECIHESWICDNYQDCKDGSDEDEILCGAPKPRIPVPQSMYNIRLSNVRIHNSLDRFSSLQMHVLFFGQLGS